jgi:hypothetical protein
VRAAASASPATPPPGADRRIRVVRVDHELDLDIIAKILFIGGLPDNPGHTEVRHTVARVLADLGLSGVLRQYDHCLRAATDADQRRRHHQWLAACRQLAERHFPPRPPRMPVGRPLIDVLDER